jgi:hypothetical protein
MLRTPVRPLALGAAQERFEDLSFYGRPSRIAPSACPVAVPGERHIQKSRSLLLFPSSAPRISE